MGVSPFFIQGVGPTPQAAFESLVAETRGECEGGCYVGTIAEKDDFMVVCVPKDEDPRQYAERLLSEGGSLVSYKRGPAGCIDLGAYILNPKFNVFLFFGIV